MIQLVQVTKSTDLNVDLKQTYEEAFPPDERREWNHWIQMLGDVRFCLNEVYNEERFIGFISVWDLDQFRFIEHFAIRDTERSKGFGSRILEQLLAQKSSPVILEVEEPFSEIARKRIAFYERMGFVVSGGEYFQPPYSAGKNSVKLLLMSYPGAIDPTDFAGVKSRIHSRVYGQNQ
ncbi:MAG: GNAT family N-acetyltransferase [Prolixibacteraceae bacterium]|nr:GNAT family N-acetyltransferase [Prolixibacteraceae bacterium]